MIGKLKGVIDDIGDDSVLIDVGGVCYEVFCAAKTLSHLPQKGEAFELMIETYVREDQIKLFGFASSLEKSWFVILTGVQGVGVRVGLAILSTLSLNELGLALAQGDKAAIGRTPGVGPKLAQRIVTELKDKMPQEDAAALGLAAHRATRSVADICDPAVGDAISALVNLGYQRPRVESIVAQITAQNDVQSTQQLIRLGLKELAS